MRTVTAARPTPHVFGSVREGLRALCGVLRRARPLTDVYVRGRLDDPLRERVMVAVSRVNACRGCSFVHTRWALRSGVTADELDAIGLVELARLDPRSRAAVAYATARAEARFRAAPPPEVTAAAATQLTPPEIKAVEAVARAMALANLTANTAHALFSRLSTARTA